MSSVEPDTGMGSDGVNGIRTQGSSTNSSVGAPAAGVVVDSMDDDIDDYLSIPTQGSSAGSPKSDAQREFEMAQLKSVSQQQNQHQSAQHQFKVNDSDDFEADFHSAQARVSMSKPTSMSSHTSTSASSISSSKSVRLQSTSISGGSGQPVAQVSFTSFPASGPVSAPAAAIPLLQPPPHPSQPSIASPSSSAHPLLSLADADDFETFEFAAPASASSENTQSIISSSSPSLSLSPLQSDDEDFACLERELDNIAKK